MVSSFPRDDTDSFNCYLLTEMMETRQMSWMRREHDILFRLLFFLNQWDDRESLNESIKINESEQQKEKARHELCFCSWTQQNNSVQQKPHKETGGRFHSSSQLERKYATTTKHEWVSEIMTCWSFIVNIYPFELSVKCLFSVTFFEFYFLLNFLTR